jgi:hypothetical protein
VQQITIVISIPLAAIPTDKTDFLSSAGHP